VGRLLVPLLLCLRGVLREPLLYLSLYFKTNRSQYYDLLNRLRTEGDWEKWVMFFAEGVKEMAESAVRTVRRLTEVAQRDRERIQRLGRISGSSLQVHQSFQKRPVSNLTSLAAETRLSIPTVTKAVQALEGEGLVREITGRRRGRVFSYEEYLNIMNDETMP
jgi:Fic family protein